MQLNVLDDLAEAMKALDGKKGWIICAMTGCACLSCMICAVSLMKASGSSTNSQQKKWRIE